MADNETIADIIAEKRRRAEEIERDCAEKMKRGEMFSDRYARELIADIRREADRLEAAHRREREAITPKSNPDWKDICAKCKDGDIEPNYCEYYEEPNGCNSPIYGEHPTAKKSLVVGDCAKMREALSAALDMIFDLQVCNRSPIANSVYAVRRKIKAALAAPPRNCDRFGCDYKMLHTAWFDWTGSPSGQNPDGTVKLTFAEWLLAPATEQEGGAK